MERNDYIILERLINEYGAEEVLNELNIPKGLMRKIAKGAIAAGLTMGGFGHNVVNAPDTESVAQYIQQMDSHRKPKSSNPYGFSDNEYSLFLDRVDAVKTEIERIFQIQKISMDELKFSPEYLVYLCHIYDFDIPLLLAQARNETAFGTTPRAQKTNTMFSLGQFDNGKNIIHFDNFDDGIEGYIKTIKSDYLLDGEKSVDDLLKDGGYVNYRNDRYASNKTYEQELRRIRNQILNLYPVLSNDINPETYISDNV